MSQNSRLAAFVNVQPDERRTVARLLLEYFFLGVTSVFTQASAFSLFLAEFGSQGLPYSYLATAVGASLAALLYLKISERAALSTSLSLNLATLGVVSILLRVGLALPDARWVVFLLPIWFQIIANLTNLALWTLAGRLFDVRQSKRLFGLIGAGNWTAIAIGGFVVSPIVGVLGTANLLFLAGISLFVAFGFQFLLLREHRAQVGINAPTRDITPRTKPANLLKNRYVLFILALVSVEWIGFFFVDNIFYDRAAAQITDVNQLAGFIGALIAATGVIGLIATTFLTGSILNRFGVGISLFILPTLLTVSNGALAVIGTLTEAALLLFGLAAFNKIIDVALGFTLDLSARTILYQPLPAAQRVRAQTVADGIVQPIAIGVAGLLLLFFNTLLAFHAVQLAYLFLIIGAAWIGAVVALRREYPRALAHALAKRRFGDTPILQIDRASLELLQQEIQSSNAGTVIYAADVMAEIAPDALTAALPELIAHPNADVRRNALERIARLQATHALPYVSQQLAVETSEELRGRELDTLARIGGARERAEAIQALSAPSPTIRLGALTGLLSRDGADDPAAERALRELAESANATERILAAQAFGAIRSDKQQDLLCALLNDKEIQVRRAALRALEKMPRPAVWRNVIELLAARETRQAASAALAAGGESILPLLQSEFDAPNTDAEIRIAIARIVGRIGGAGACDFLKHYIQYPGAQVRTKVLAALERCRYHAQGNDAERVRTQLHVEAEQAVVLLAARDDFAQEQGLDFLTAALDADLAQNRERLFYLLSFLYDANTIRNARENLLSGAPEQHAYALEVLDVSLPRELKPIVLPLLENLTPAQRLARFDSILPHERLGRAERLQQIMNAPDSTWSAWVQACAQYAVNRPEGKEVGHSMFSTVELVGILKGVDIFAETPVPVLADVAAVLQQLEVNEGETIFQKGDLGDSLYMIVSGRVRVHDGAHTLNYLEEGEVFGEIALLDPEPRSASVTAVEATQLLRLDQQSFQELLEERAEIARAIIKVLTRRLRERSRELIAAHAARES
ncbi:MAG TPA: Npt1/Npt2 family nucleotide transporter [Anaerolineae bacterium]|nr:Npt1/Npt2 family nucleotide transporter [Anaerolineae bacterium]